MRTAAMSFFKGNGKARPHDCKCDYRYTCGPCLKMAANRIIVRTSR